VRRREFITLVGGVAIALPLTASAQRPKKLYRIGMLERTSPVINAVNLDGFRRGLRELGYIEGQPMR